MHLTATMQLSLPASRAGVRLAKPTLRAFSAGSAYLGRRMEHIKLLGVSQLPSRRRSSASQPVQASFFGVGAPEAILVGVVALVVFGPKGLAQAAKSLGSTLRSFAPTIREITSVSQELKSTLEQEIGINDIREELTRPLPPTPRPPRTDTLASSGDADTLQQQGAALSELAESMQRPLDPSQATLVDPDIERKRAEAAAAAWGGVVPGSAATVPAAAAAAPPPPLPAAPAPAVASTAGAGPRAVEAMSVEELEAELARRKATATSRQVPQQLSADD